MCMNISDRNFRRRTWTLGKTFVDRGLGKIPKNIKNNRELALIKESDHTLAHTHVCFSLEM